MGMTQDEFEHWQRLWEAGTDDAKASLENMSPDEFRRRWRGVEPFLEDYNPPWPPELQDEQSDVQRVDLRTTCVLTAEDCVFLWSLGIRADEDIAQK